MPVWLMKRDDDQYVLWDTLVDEVVSPVMDRDRAIAVTDDSTVEWTDKHLCSCRARLGENIVVRNGRAVMVGGGALAYHFDDYAAVRRYLHEVPDDGVLVLEWRRDPAYGWHARLRYSNDVTVIEDYFSSDEVLASATEHVLTDPATETSVVMAPIPLSFPFTSGCPSTLGAMRLMTGFRDRRIQPLCHLSGGQAPPKVAARARWWWTGRCGRGRGFSAGSRRTLAAGRRTPAPAGRCRPGAGG